MNLTTPQVVRHKPTGELLVTRSRHEASKWGAAHWRCSPIDNANTTRGYSDDELEPAPPHKPGGFDFKTEIVPRAQGALPWEHVEPADLVRTLANISACAGWSAYPGIAWVKKPGSHLAEWARIFLHTTQGSEYTGQAHALVYEGDPRRKPAHLIDAVVSAAVRAVPARDLTPGRRSTRISTSGGSRRHRAEPMNGSLTM